MCFPSRCCACDVVMKNCEELVLGPAFAMDKSPGPVLELKIFVPERAPVDGEPASSIAAGHVAALHHETGDGSVKDRALVVQGLLVRVRRLFKPAAAAFTSRCKAREVLRRSRRNLAKEAHDDAACRLAVDLEVEDPMRDFGQQCGILGRRCGRSLDRRHTRIII